MLSEVNRQAQAIGLNTGGTFAQSLSVFIGGGRAGGSNTAIQNGSVVVDLSKSAVDTQALGLSGYSAQRARAAVDIGDGAGTTSVANILSNTTNQATKTQAGFTQFYFTGPGFANTSGDQPRGCLGEPERRHGRARRWPPPSTPPSRQPATAAASRPLPSRTPASRHRSSPIPHGASHLQFTSSDFRLPGGSRRWHLQRAARQHRFRLHRPVGCHQDCHHQRHGIAGDQRQRRVGNGEDCARPTGPRPPLSA